MTDNEEHPTDKIHELKEHLTNKIHELEEAQNLVRHLAQMIRIWAATQDKQTYEKVKADLQALGVWECW